MKLGAHIFAISASILVLTSCQKMDTFDQAGMMEVFNGTMRITPGISSDIQSEIVSVGLYSYNSNGKEVVIADASAKAISIREMLLKDATEEDIEKFKLLLKIKGLNEFDELAFSGFRGTVVEGSDGKLLNVNRLEATTKGIDMLNVKVEGTAKLDKSNKQYITSDIHIYIEREDLINFLPDILDFFTVGDEEIPLSELEDENFVLSIAKINFVGVAITGLL